MLSTLRRPRLSPNFLARRTYVHFPISSEEFFALFSSSPSRRKEVRVKFTNKMKDGLASAGTNLRSKIESRIDKTMEKRPRLKDIRVSYKKKRDEVRRFRYEHSMSIKLPEGGEFNKDLGRGWFDSCGKPLATKTRFGRYVVPWGVDSTKKSFSEFLGWQWERGEQMQICTTTMVL